MDWDGSTDCEWASSVVGFADVDAFILRVDLWNGEPLFSVCGPASWHCSIIPPPFNDGFWIPSHITFHPDCVAWNHCHIFRLSDQIWLNCKRDKRMKGKSVSKIGKLGGWLSSGNALVTEGKKLFPLLCVLWGLWKAKSEFDFSPPASGKCYGPIALSHKSFQHNKNQKWL